MLENVIHVSSLYFIHFNYYKLNTVVHITDYSLFCIKKAQ